MRRRASLLLLFLMASIACAQNPVRVACVGDSITYGAELPDRTRQSYPAVLARLSGGRCETGNFGVCAATALQGTGRAWTDTPACRDALAFDPGIVVVMLGINDLAFPDRCARYPADLRSIIARFQSLPSAPRVFLCTLTPIAPGEQQAPANRAIRETMNPAIRAVAAETGAAVIDIAAAYPNRLDLLPDGLHPSPEGAELIARTVLSAIAPESSPPPQIHPAPVAGPVDLSIRNEALAARSRAELWIETQPPFAGFHPPSAAPDAASLLPLLSGNLENAGDNLFSSFASLALALDRNGEETVFLPDGRPVAWREALLHQLVQRQRIDPRGGGYWTDPRAADPAADAPLSTACALEAIATALDR